MVFKRPLGSQIVTFKTFAKLLLLSLFAYFFITTTSSILYTVNLNVRRMTRNLYLHIINYANCGECDYCCWFGGDKITNKELELKITNKELVIKLLIMNY